MNFKQKVYLIVKKIPRGKVLTYKQVAEKLNTKAYRAVGNILAKNTSELIPCHRVVRSDGFVGGFKGSLNNKEKIKLLRKEGVKIRKNRVILSSFS